jgi:hypothetical protein
MDMSFWGEVLGFFVMVGIPAIMSWGFFAWLGKGAKK